MNGHPPNPSSLTHLAIPPILKAILSSPNGQISSPLIIGHYGGSNTGDEAMLAGLLSGMQSGTRKQATVVVKEGTLAETYPNLGTTIIPADLGSVVRALFHTDSLVLGGGTHFHDDYTTARYLRHFRHMLRIAGLSMLAKLMGRKVTWLGMGFGPFFRLPTEWVTKWGLKFCDRVTVRDENSLKQIALWVPQQKVALSFDLSALMVGNSHGCLKAPRKERFHCKTLGVSVTSVRQSRTGGPEIDSLLRKHLASALKRALENYPELQLKIMVIRGGTREDDTAVSMELHQDISGSYPGRSRVIPYHADPAETVREIVECDAVVATRYHACVLAYLAGCRLFFIAYHRKVHDLAGEIGLSDDACIEMTHNVTEEQIARQLDRLVAGEGAFQARLPVTDAEQRAQLSIRALME